MAETHFPPVSQDIRSARESVGRMLDEMELRAFVYTVEPKEGAWTLRIDCATGDGWQETTLAMEPGELLAALHDPVMRRAMRMKLEAHLSGCAKRGHPAARWEHYPHEADMGVRGIGATKAEAFEQAALAMTAVIADPETIEPREVVSIECDATDDELLLAEWLNKLVFEMATRKMLFSRFAVHIEGPRLRARAWGEHTEVSRHHPAVEIKGQPIRRCAWRARTAAG